MARKAKQIPAGSPVEENRQPAHAEAIASASAGAPSGEGPGEADRHEKVASEAGAVASAPEPRSTDDRSAKPKDGDPAVPAKAGERIGVTVTGPKNGRRRLGRRFDERPQVIGVTAGELEILRTDPTLSVELV